MYLKNVLIFCLLPAFYFSYSQTYRISGEVRDSDGQLPLSGATVKLTSLRDTTLWKGAAADEKGKFEFSGVIRGGYRLQINYTGYAAHEEMVFVSNEDKALPAIRLSKSAKELGDVNVVEQATRVVQKEDTSEYNARAYKTNPDATTEDLITKMPGITVEKGTVKAQGEEVKKVTVDGKDFFGDDASVALRNLPGEVVDRIQVFDRMNDFAQLTGFDDGTSQKSMNIITRQGRNNGVFGRVYAGYGYLNNHRYSAGANLSYFKGERRLTFIGMSNNVNQQNFSMQDIIGVMGGSGGGPRFGGMMMGGRRAGGFSGGRSGSGGGMSDFMVGQQGGISTTHSAGINYTDMWGKKVKVNGSYFFNYTDNINQTDLTRTYFNQTEGDSLTTTYFESNNVRSKNMNHRVNLRIEYSIDSMNKIIFTPRASFQQNQQRNLINGRNTIGGAELLGQTESNYFASNTGYNLSGDLLYQHKFKTPKRTLSIGITPTVNNKKGNTELYSINKFFTDSALLDQNANTSSENYTLSGSISYTEPAGKQGILQFSYNPSYTWNKSEKVTFNYDSTTADYTRQDTLLTNTFDNTYMTQRGGVTYRFANKKISLMAGINAQYAWLNGEQYFPLAFTTQRTFFNVLPTAMFNYKFSDKANMRVYYRTSTNPPSVSQLQNVIDNSNPLLLSTGNPDLKQNFSHFGVVRFSWADAKKGRSFFAFFSPSFTHNYIGNATLIATSDTLLNGDVLLRRGSQLTLPVNFSQGSLNLNSFFTYGMPINPIKCNLNLNAGFGYNRNPSLINQALNFSNTYMVNGGFVLGSNISEKIDFTISYMGTYNIVKNTLQQNSDNNYFNHTASARFNWLFWKGFLFNTGLQNTLFAGVSQGFNQNIFLWDASLGYKFLKDKSLEVKVTGFDLLNQNTGINRSVNETYLEDTRTQVLKRYWLLKVTYTLRYFKKA